MKADVKYIYGITNSGCSDAERIFGVGENVLGTIDYRDICAVVSEVDGTYTLSMDDAVIHDRVLRTLVEVYSILPVSFGLVAPDEIEVARLLERGYSRFRSALTSMEGVIQADVSIFWRGSVYQYLLSNSSKLRAISELVRKKPEDLNLKIELGRLTRQALNEREVAILPGVMDQLKAFTLKNSEKPLKSEVNIANISFLMGRADQGRFLDAVERFQLKYAELIDFKVVIPLPPYGFVKLRVEKPNIAKIEVALGVLGVNENVDKLGLEKIYGEKVQSFHPDHVKSDGKKFYEIQDAYLTLKRYFDCYDYNENMDNIKKDIIIKDIEY